MNLVHQSVNNALDFVAKNSVVIASTSGLLFACYLFKKLYISGGVCQSQRRLDGKTVIITGANTGIGKETALDLAKRGARVILACRDMNKASDAAKWIRKISGNEDIIIEELDLASFDSIRLFAETILIHEKRIDIFINNAAVMACPRSLTEDGFELQFGTNHLGHFLLTNLLLDRLKESAPSRIVIVSALAHECKLQT